VQRNRCRGAEVQQRGGGADQGAEVVQSRSRGDCAGAEVVQSRGRGCIDLVERSRCKCAEVARWTEAEVLRCRGVKAHQRCRGADMEVLRCLGGAEVLVKSSAEQVRGVEMQTRCRGAHMELQSAEV